MKLRKWIIFSTIILCLIFVLLFILRDSKNNYPRNFLLLVSDNIPFDNPIVTAWNNTAKEIGIILTVMHDASYLDFDWHKKNTYAGIILPDVVHNKISPALLGELIKYLNSGGKLMVVYDSGIKNIRNRYFIDQPPFGGVMGLKYGLYQELKNKAIAFDYIGGQPKILLELGIPPGKFIEVDAEKGNYIPKNLLDNNNFSLISTYIYGLIKYPHLVTQGKYEGEVLLSTQSRQVIAGISSRGLGKTLFINLPLGYLCVQTDCMFQQIFLKYFAQNVSDQPILSSAPNGIGGLVANLHVDSEKDIEQFDRLKSLGFFEQGPYSLHFTAGPDVNYFGDKLGMDLSHRKQTQEWLDYFIKKNYAIGDHGGWIHNYFGLNVNDHNKNEFEQYLFLNNNSVETVTGKKTLEYSAPVGNMPEWIVAWIQDYGFTSYYTSGNTGSAPTRSFVNGELKYMLWSFPILTLYDVASLEELSEANYSPKVVSEWLKLISNFVSDLHIIRMFYFHPHGAQFYPDTIRDWLSETKKLLNSQTFRWYTMTQITDFLNQRDEVEWSIQNEKKEMIISAYHRNSLENQAWLILKKSCDHPLISEGVGKIKEDDIYWIISVISGKKIIFSCHTF